MTASATSTATFFSSKVFLRSAMTGSISSFVNVCEPATLFSKFPTFLPEPRSSAPASSSLSSSSSNSSSSSQAAFSPSFAKYVPRISSRCLSWAACCAAASPWAPLLSRAATSAAVAFLFRWEPSRQTVGFLPAFSPLSVGFFCLFFGLPEEDFVAVRLL